MTLLADEGYEPGAGPGGAMRITTDTGFGTVSSTLIALPANGRNMAPIWLFAPGPPGVASYAPVRLDD
jgi:hypothetical protein